MTPAYYVNQIQTIRFINQSIDRSIVRSTDWSINESDGTVAVECDTKKYDENERRHLAEVIVKFPLSCLFIHCEMRSGKTLRALVFLCNTLKWRSVCYESSVALRRTPCSTGSHCYLPGCHSHVHLLLIEPHLDTYMQYTRKQYTVL